MKNKMASNIRSRASAPLYLALVVTLIVCVLAYWPGLSGAYLFDDYNGVVDNPYIQMQSLTWASVLQAVHGAQGAVSRPLTYLSFALNYRLTGPDPYWMKLTNVAIHLANAVLLFGFLRALFETFRIRRAEEQEDRDGYLALAITAAWMLLPINLTAVLYVVQRMESLANLWVFGGLWLYVAGRRRTLLDLPGGLWRITTALFVCTAIGLTFKETAALLPLYAFLLEFCLFHFAGNQGRTDRRLYWMYASMLALLVAGIVLFVPDMIGAGYATRPFTLVQRLLTEPRVVSSYMAWTLVPTPNALSFYHDSYALSTGLLRPATTAFALLFISLLVAAVFFFRKRLPLFSVGIALFLGGQVLTATFIPLELIYEHRNYFASAGLLLAVFSLIAPGKQSAVPAIRWVGVLAFIVFYGGVTTLRASEWGDPIRLAYSIQAQNPRSPRATYELGRTLLISSQYRHDSKLLPKAMEAFERAATLPDASILPEQALLVTAYKVEPHLPVDPAWWDGIFHKLATRPSSAEDIAALYSLNACALAHVCEFDARNMVHAFATALERPDADTEIDVMYANYAIQSLHDLGLAERLMIDALAKDPSNTDFQNNLQKIRAAERRHR